MSDYGGRLIRATEPTVSTTTASGIWTIEEALKYKQAGTWPVQQTADPNFKQTVLLLHGDGTNGAQNNTFLDSSTNNFTITRNGNTTQGTFSPFSLPNGEWSNYFDGTGDYLSVADNAAWDMGSGNFTAEAWVYANSFPSEAMIMGQWSGDVGGTTLNWALMLSASGGNLRLITSSNGSSVLFDLSTSTTSFALTLNTWHHVAAVRNGNTFTIYVDGVSRATTTNSSTLYNATNSFTIGAESNTPTQLWNGYISNARIVKGTAVYTAAFTPPTTPLTAITNTSLLTCQSNRFVDNSTNNFAITRNGDVRVTPFSPFAPSAAYSAGTNGGSGYFDGSGDSVSAASDAAFAIGTGDYSIECWIYFVDTAAGGGLSGEFFGSSTSNAIVLRYASGTFAVSRSGTADDMSASVTLTTNQWYHLCATRTGTNGGLYVNGNRVATNASYTANYAQGLMQVYSGTKGYLTGCRLIKGSNPYGTGTTLTVPTAPLTAITNTSLLLNFTNAGIFDNTGKNNLETVGNAQIDTTTKKFGTGSMEFDRVDDRLVGASPDVLTFGTGDFTVEAWVNFRSFTSGFPQLISTNTGTNGQPQFAFTSTTAYVYGPSLTTYSRSFTWALNTWYHVAFVRASGSLTIYVNGSALGTSQSMSENLVSPNFSVGAYASGSANGMFDGFIDDLRVTRGVARYPTEPFPTAPFPDF